MKYKINEGNMLGVSDTWFNNDEGDIQIKEIRFIAGEALIKGRLVEISAFNASTGEATVIHATAGSYNTIGVAMFDYESGYTEVAIETEGWFALTAAGAITLPNHVIPAADGKVAAWVGDGTDSDAVVGKATSTASADGDRILVKFTI